DAPGLAEPSEEHLGARDDEPLHGCVPRIAEARELRGGGSGRLRRRRGVSLRHRDLHARRTHVRTFEGSFRQRFGALERSLCELEIAERGVRDPPQRQPQAALVATYQAERAERITPREGAPRLTSHAPCGRGAHVKRPSAGRPAYGPTSASVHVAG